MWVGRGVGVQGDGAESLCYFVFGCRVMLRNSIYIFPKTMLLTIMVIHYFKWEGDIVVSLENHRKVIKLFHMTATGR